MRSWKSAMGILAAILLATVAGCAGADGTAAAMADGPDDREETATAGTVAVELADPAGFNPVGGQMRFRLDGASFDASPSSVTVLHNDDPVAAGNIAMTTGDVSLLGGLVEGLDHVELLAADHTGASVYAETAIWAGTATLEVNVVDDLGMPVAGADVRVFLAEAPSVGADAVTPASGIVAFADVPDRTVVVEARDGSGALGSLATHGGAGSVEVVLRGFGMPSPIANNDFSQGTAGWAIGMAPVQIVPHVEGTLLVGASLAGMPDMDLELETAGEGPQSISRTFQIAAGTKAVAVRHRFVTSEVPGGYFGTKFNDYFSVTIRSVTAKGETSDKGSMNGLGLAAFDAQGATAWREASLPVSVAGDTVQVDITVANVADGLFDSKVIVDFVQEKKLAITALELRDIDNAALAFLSASPHPYFGGNTRVHGTITVEGAEDHALQSLALEIIQGGTVVATGNLAAAAAGPLLQPFGADEKVEVAASQLLFEIPSGELGKIATAQNGTVSLRVRAKTAQGEEATRDAQAVELLVRFTGTNRYPDDFRDDDVGGDDWALPSVRALLDQTGSVTMEREGQIVVVPVNFGDLSNMNGGPFPPHDTHRGGLDADAWFDGYNARTTSVAAALLEILAVHGTRIQLIYVTYSEVPGNQIYDAIRSVVLGDGRKAIDVIRPFGGHDTHFHIRFRR